MLSWVFEQKQKQIVDAQKLTDVNFNLSLTAD